MEGGTGMTARERFRADTAQALHDWHMFVIPPRPNPHVVQDAIREIIRLRMWIAYMPLLQGLERIEKRVQVLCDIREDPYAPPKK
jgi:hypothetical protein